MADGLPTSSRRDRPNFLKAAFWNVYNITSLSGIAVAALATNEPWLLGIGLAAEALWLLLVPDNKRFQRAINATFQEERRLAQIKELLDQTQFLPSERREKVQAVQVRAAEVKQECLRNPRLQGDFMAVQLDRLDGLVASYANLAVTITRSEAYLARTDVKRMTSERGRWLRELETQDPAGNDIAQQNVTILDKRLAIYQQLEKFTERGIGQMSLIENTISLLRDQVMTMATPEALTGQLDELVTSVEAIGESVRDAEAVVSAQASLAEEGLLIPESGQSVGRARVRG